MSLIDLSGKAALVTGGSRGIGAATAKLLAQGGAMVAITYRERKQEAQDVIGELERLGKREKGKGRGTGNGGEGTVRSIALQGDVSHKEDCQRFVAETVAALGGLDIFVANAGIWYPEEVALTEMDDEQWRRTMAVNLDSVFYGCRAALKTMTRERGKEEKGKGLSVHRAIVIVSSTASQRGEGYHADYAASKGAVNSFVKSLAVEAAPEVNVNAVAPGWVDTAMCDIPFGRDSGEGRRAIESGIPLGRVASAADVAGPIVFLCSEMARHVTGEILNVNGGAVLCG